MFVVCAKRRPLEFCRRWPTRITSPGDPQFGPGQLGGENAFEYVTVPVAGASCTCLTPVVLKPCESDCEMTLARTRIGALPGCAWISTSRSEKGCACAMSVTDAEGTRMAAAPSPTSSTSAAAV